VGSACSSASSYTGQHKTHTHKTPPLGLEALVTVVECSNTVEPWTARPPWPAQNNCEFVAKIEKEFVLGTWNFCVFGYIIVSINFIYVSCIVFGPKRKWPEAGEDHITRRFVTCTLHETHRITKVIKSRRWDGTSSTHGIETRNEYNTLFGKPEGTRQLGNPRRRWEGNTEMDLREIRCEIVNCIHLVQDRDYWRDLVTTVINFRALQKVGNFVTVSFSSRTLPHEVSLLVSFRI